MNDDAALLDAVRGIRWPARRLVPAAAHGAHRSRRRGMSAEFMEYRPYAQGDDPRRLDWKLLARSDRAFVRLTDDHALFPTVFAVDGTASMAFPPETTAKWQHARRLAFALASIAHAGGDPVGLALGSRLVLPPRTRSGVVREVADTLGAVRPGATVGTSLSALVSAAATGPRVGRIVIVSDLLTSDEDATGALAVGRAVVPRGGECYVIHVVATEEMAPSGRDAMVEDPENPEIRRPLVGAAHAAYERAFADWRVRMAREWRAAGATYVLTTTDERADHVVRRVVAASA